MNSAPNDLPPAVFADRAAAAARDAGLTVQVLDEKALAKGGYGGILGVGSGSSRPPRLVRVSYTPAGAKASVALVGKGITFDSGGLSIKPAAKMDQMTSDMAGAAAVDRDGHRRRQAATADRGHRHRRAGREPAVRHRLPAR